MKIKRMALSLLSCFALLVSSIPSTAVFVSAVNGEGTAANPYTASSYAELKEALSGVGVDADGISYIKLTGTITNEDNTIEISKKVQIDGDNNTITGKNIRLTGDVTLKNLTFTTDDKQNAVIIGNATTANTVTFEGVTITQTAPSESKDIVTAIWINSKNDVTPNVTLKDCNITVNSNANVKDRARAIVLSDEGTAGTGSGNLTLDNTTVTANEDKGGKAVGIDILAKGAVVKIQNGSKIIVPKRYGISVYSQDANITIDNSEVEAWGAIYFRSGTKDNYKSTNNTVNIQNKSKIKSVNPYTNNDNNFSAICFEGSGDSVTLDETSSIECKGSGEDGRAQYVASFYSTDNNKLTVNGSISTEDNPSDLDLFFAYSQNGDIDEAPETPAVVIGEKATVPGFTLNDSEGNFKQTYEKLSEAVENAEENDIIVMGENSEEEVKVEKKLTIQRKGYTANVTSEKYDVIVSEESYVVDDHKYVEQKVTKCDGTEGEYTYYTCSTCNKYFEKTGEEYNEVEFETVKGKIDSEAGHKTEVVKGKAATCSEVGYTDGLQCTECGETIIARKLINRDSNNHVDAGGNSTWGDPKPVAADDDHYDIYPGVTNCKDGGWLVIECTACGAKQYKHIEKGTEHTWSEEHTDVVDATCTTDGSYVQTCKVCGQKETVNVPKTNHNIQIQKAKDATCTDDGNIVYWYCTECDTYFSNAAGTEVIEKKESVKLEATGHEYVPVEGKVPTCTDSGYSEYEHCSKCGAINPEKTKDFLPVNPNGHVCDVLLGERVEPTCTNKGAYAYFQCSACEKYYKITATDDSGVNTYVEITMEGDSPADGEIDIPATGHSWGAVTPKVEPTCDKDGKEAYAQCENCNKYTKVTYAPEDNDKANPQYDEENLFDDPAAEPSLTITKLGHDWKHSEATCTTNEFYFCDRCDKLASVEESDQGAGGETLEGSIYLKYVDSLADLAIPGGAHTWGADVVGEPTCTGAGHITYAVCDECGAYAEKTNDGYKEWNAVENDANGDGKITEADFAAEKLGHDFDLDNEVEFLAPDKCISEGHYGSLYCKRCEKYFRTTDETGEPLSDYVEVADESELVIPAEEHTYSSELISKDATCTEPGMKPHYECSVCGKFFTEDKVEADESTFMLPEKGHNSVTYAEAKAATCTSTGLTEGKKCATCGIVLVPQTVTAMLSHNYEKVADEKPATCQETGKKEYYKCTNGCGLFYTKNGDVYTATSEADLVIPKKDHVWGEYTDNTPATCTENATQKAKCQNDGCTAEDIKEVEGSALGHNYVAVEAVKESCTEDGMKEHYKCSREDCGQLFVKNGEEYTSVTEQELVIPAKGHTPEVLQPVESTCTESGLTEGSRCKDCGETLVNQIPTPMKPHTPTADAAVEATCTKSGLTAGSHCSVCGGTIVVQTVIPALGHNYDKNGVCTRDGAKNPNYKPAQSQKPQTDVKVLKITQAKLTKLKVKSKAKNTINVEWKKVKNAKGYEVEVSKNSSFKTKARVLLKSTKKLKLKIKNKKKLKSKKIYYVRARAYTTYKAANGSTQKAYSNWNYVLRKVKVK